MRLIEIGGKAKGVIKEEEGIIVLDGNKVTVKQLVELLKRLPGAYFEAVRDTIIVHYRR